MRIIQVFSNNIIPEEIKMFKLFSCILDIKFQGCWFCYGFADRDCDFFHDQSNIADLSFQVAHPAHKPKKVFDFLINGPVERAQ